VKSNYFRYLCNYAQIFNCTYYDISRSHPFDLPEYQNRIKTFFFSKDAALRSFTYIFSIYFTSILEATCIRKKLNLLALANLTDRYKIAGGTKVLKSQTFLRKIL